MDLKEEYRKIIKYMLDDDASSDLIENYVDTFILINEEYKKQLTLTEVVSSSCDCKKHSIKTSYGFEVCTKCGNEWDK